MSKKEKPIGLIIRQLRENAEISQEELASRAAIHRTYVSQLERGIKSPTIAVLQKLAHALGTTASEILRAMEGQL